MKTDSPGGQCQAPYYLSGHVMKNLMFFASMETRNKSEIPNCHVHGVLQGWCREAEVNLRTFWARYCGAAFRLFPGHGVLCSLLEKHGWAILALGFSCSWPRSRL